MASPVPPATIVPPVIKKCLDRADFFSALGRIMEMRKKYLRNRHIFITGDEMHPLLRALGAREDDFERMKHVSTNLGKDPTLPFRQSRQARFVFDYGKQSIYRSEHQPFILSTKEGFKRHDSDFFRVFEQMDKAHLHNTVVQALLLFKTFFFQGVETTERPYQDYTSDKWICTLFSLRTTTSPELLGEPALEGVHSDGVDHTMVTMLGHDNMADQSAITFVHDMRERLGINIDETQGSLVRGVAQHWDFLDTVIVVDNERFHSLTPVWQVDKTVPATRDVLIFFTRKPAAKGHASYGVDSVKPHETLPLELPLYMPFA